MSKAQISLQMKLIPFMVILKVNSEIACEIAKWCKRV